MHTEVVQFIKSERIVMAQTGKRFIPAFKFNYSRDDTLLSMIIHLAPDHRLDVC